MNPIEQIIIDGVDVSKCEFYMHYDYGKFSHGCSLHKDMFGLPVCCDIADCCKDCYFKQLARKTAECESLKEEIEVLKDNFDTATRDCNELIEELKQECEELKKQLETSEEWRIKAESLNEKLELRNTCYRKALEEIEGLVKNFCKDCDDYEDCNWEKEGCYYSLIPNLKDIINKAKDGKQ